MNTDQTKDPVCSVRDGKFVTPCSTLKEACEGRNPPKGRKGIYAWVLSKNFKPSRTMFGIQGGKFKTGMMFNWCPFCGTKIDAPFAEQLSDTDEGVTK